MGPLLQLSGAGGPSLICWGLLGIPGRPQGQHAHHRAQGEALGGGSAPKWSSVGEGNSFGVTRAPGALFLSRVAAAPCPQQRGFTEWLGRLGRTAEIGALCSL